MASYKNYWTDSESLGTDNLERDWDYFSSMLDSIRLYLFDHGTVPTWNFMLCGGKPELGNPQSWAYTLPSLLGYILPANLALFTIWILLSALGFWVVRRLLFNWFQSPVGAAFGASIFVFNGYLASHFTQGHSTFVFYSLIPLLIYAFEKSYNERLSGKSQVGSNLLILATSWLLFTASLPHALFYFYPAFALFILVRTIWDSRVKKISGTLKAAAGALAFHILGLVVSAYKFIPILRYQQDNPRGGVEWERIPLDVIFDNLTRFSTRYEASAPAVFVGQKWGYWEYNAYIGLTPLLMAAAGIAISIKLFGAKPYKKKKRDAKKEGASEQDFGLAYVTFGIAILVTGVLLSLGNDHGLSPASIFHKLPFFSGIRVFARYQILILFAVSVLGAFFLAVGERMVPQWKKALWACAILGAGPGIYQTFTLVKDLRSTSVSELQTSYGFNHTPVPQLAKQSNPAEGTSMQSYLLREGYWVANCYEAISVPGIDWPGTTLPLSGPTAPNKVNLGSNYFELIFDGGTLPQEDLRLNYPVTQYLSFEPAPAKVESGFAWFRGADVAKAGKIKVTADTSPVTTGLIISLVGLLASFALLGCIAVRKRKSEPSPSATDVAK
jgi:hypothetical protein